MANTNMARTAGWKLQVIGLMERCNQPREKVIREDTNVFLRQKIKSRKDKKNEKIRLKSKIVYTCK